MGVLGVLRFVGLDSFLTARSLTAAVAQCGLIACLLFLGRLAIRTGLLGFRRSSFFFENFR